MKNIKYLFLTTVLLGFLSCDDDEYFGPEEPVQEPLEELTAGSADFSTYVSLGNSLTAGFTDGALFIAGQENSFPNLLSQKFALVGGGTFTQPLTNDNIGGLLLAGNPILDAEGENQFAPRLVFGGAGPVPLQAIVPTATSSTDIVANNPTGPFNNLGVPGAKSFHLLAPGYGNVGNLPLGRANPYAVRLTGSTPDASVVSLAVAQNPTFFSLWIGNNDVLGYALSGGDGTDPITPVDGPPGVGFNQTYGALIATLTASGAQGVVANIPNVTSIPHFTTVPFNPLDPTDENFGPQIPTLNGIFGQLNQVFAFLEGQGIPNATDRQIVFSSTEASAVVIRDETLMDLSEQIAATLSGSPTFPAFVQSFGLPVQAAPLVAGLLGNVYGQARQATEDDLFVLPSSSVIGTVNSNSVTFLTSQGLPLELAGQFSVEGISLPLEDKWVLLPSEQAEISAATSTFNATIEAAAGQAGLAFVDANSILTQVANGDLDSGDFTLTSALVQGGAFSLDGVHPTARGYALIANEFMKAIDVTYGSNFEASGNLYDIGDYPTNYSPILP